MQATRAGTLLLLTLLFGAASCRSKSKPGQNGAPSEVLALDVTPGIGSAEPGALLCDAKGRDCHALGPNEGIPPGSLVRTARGGRASVSLSGKTELELDDDAQVRVTKPTVIELEQGSIVLDRVRPADAHDDLSFSVRLADRIAELDSKMDTRLAAHAGRPGRATLTVEKGKVVVRGPGGASLVLLSGETADFAPGRPPARSTAFVSVEPPFRKLGSSSPGATGRSASTSAPLVLATGERGLGRMTARMPGRSEVVGGVRLVSHHVAITIRDAIARTEIEETFQNDTAHVLEGRYVFPLPTDASISRLALWVGDKLVEGEVVEKKRAATIFKNIVDDTVRPRDPALLEWVAGGDFSLKVFPLPPKGTRRVKLAYDQALTGDGGRVRYVYPLHAGEERAVPVDDFSIQVRATDTRSKIGDFSTPGYATLVRADDRSAEIDFRAARFTPESDFVVSFEREADDPDAEVSSYVPAWGKTKAQGLESITPFGADDAKGPGYVAVRIRADLANEMSPPAHVRRDRIIVVDASHGQSRESLDASLDLALGLVDRLDEGERFAVLACDSACEAYPDSGLADAGPDAPQKLAQWTKERTPHGSSDIAGALLDAVHHLTPGGSGQIIYVGDGAASSGELSVAHIAERVRPALAGVGADLRIIGAGRALDRLSLEGLARELGATYEPLGAGSSLARRISEISLELRSPVIVGPELALPPSFTDVYPRTLPNLRLGQELIVVARLSSWEPGEIVLSGNLGSQPYRLAKRVRWTEDAARQNPLVPRLWALGRIGDLEVTNEPAVIQQVVDLSKRFHVMSRFTSLLVLENDAMYTAYGIKRTAPDAGAFEQELAATAPAADPGAAAQTAAANADPALDYDETARATEKTEAPAPARKRASAVPAAPPPSPVPAARMTPAAAPAPTVPFAAAPPETSSPFAGGSDTGRASSSGSDFASSSGSGVGLEPKGNDLTLAEDEDAHARSVGGTLGLAAPAFYPSVRAGTPRVSEGLSRDVVARVVRQSLPRIRLCYESALHRAPSLAGTLVAAFAIGLEGTVRDAGIVAGDVHDAPLRACIAGVLRSLVFPRPNGATVSVSYPFVLAREPLSPPTMDVPRRPIAVHRAGDEKWIRQGDEALAALRRAVEAAPDRRKRREDLVRGLLVHGRFDEAREEAERFVSLDPDYALAEELLSYAAAAAGDARGAVTAVDDQTENDPASVSRHSRAAKAFEAVGDERRACAHWRSAAELLPRAEAYVYQALRCRARVLDDRAGALTDLHSFSKPGKLLASLEEDLEAGRPPVFTRSTGTAGALEAEVVCSDRERCPAVLVLSPNGNVVSPITPTDARSSPTSVALATVQVGTYRTLLIGGDQEARGHVKVRALGNSRTFAFARGGEPQTIAATSITFAPRRTNAGAPPSLGLAR